jgi:hypothetical protein
LEKNSQSKPACAKAGALLCPVCCVEYVEVEFDFEEDGFLLRNVKALRCPCCGEEVFTPQQVEAIRQRIADFNQST